MNNFHLLRFGSRFDAGRAYVFPCDAAGRVDLCARTVVGREFTAPIVRQPGTAQPLPARP